MRYCFSIWTGKALFTFIPVSSGYLEQSLFWVNDLLVSSVFNTIDLRCVCVCVQQLIFACSSRSNCWWYQSTATGDKQLEIPHAIHLPQETLTSKLEIDSDTTRATQSAFPNITDSERGKCSPGKPKSKTACGIARNLYSSASGKTKKHNLKTISLALLGFSFNDVLIIALVPLVIYSCLIVSRSLKRDWRLITECQMCRRYQCHSHGQHLVRKCKINDLRTWNWSAKVRFSCCDVVMFLSALISVEQETKIWDLSSQLLATER